MKNITLSADDELIERARDRARRERTTLNDAFRRWLQEYAGPDQQASAARHAIDRLRQKIDTGGRKFTREEMNER